MFSKMNRYSDCGLLAMRIVIGVIFILHGHMKWPMWDMSPSEQMPATMLTLIKILCVAEPLGGLALITGLFPRYAAIGHSLVMLGAINLKINVWHTGFISQHTTGWEFDLLILAALVSLFLSGPGKYSLDRLLSKE